MGSKACVNSLLKTTHIIATHPDIEVTENDFILSTSRPLCHGVEQASRRDERQPQPAQVQDQSQQAACRMTLSWPCLAHSKLLCPWIWASIVAHSAGRSTP